MKVKHLVAATALSMVAVAGASATPTLVKNGMTLDVTGQAVAEIPNDQAVIEFVALASGRDSAKVSDAVVKRANAAMATLKDYKSFVQAQTTDLSVWPVYTKPMNGKTPVIGSWEARDALRVTVKDVNRVSDVLKAVAGHMDYDGIRFSVSDKTRQAQNDALLKAAIADAVKKAGIVAAQFGKNEQKIRIVKIDADQVSGAYPRVYAARMAPQALNAAPAAPTISVGTSKLSLNVNMQVKIRN